MPKRAVESVFEFDFYFGFKQEQQASGISWNIKKNYMNAFEALGLNEQLVQATTDLGFETPTPIQEQAIPILLSGTTDFVGLAQTGTGKTAAFGLPLLQLLNAAEKYPQALIVCPTRELCLQITNDIVTFTK